MPFLHGASPDPESPEIEFLFLPGNSGFSGRAECNVLVLMDDVARPPLRQAHILVSDREDIPFDPALSFRPDDFHRLWQAL